jgi:hypothetical protein
MIMWQDVTETTQFIELLNDRVPVTVEGMLYLAAKYKALELDYNALVDEIHELEHELKHADESNEYSWRNRHEVFLDPY